jgi:hypothetical protein
MVLSIAVEPTSLKEIDTPGNLVDCTTVTPSGFGGNEAANAVSATEHATNEALRVNIAAVCPGRREVRDSSILSKPERYLGPTL